MARRLRSSSSRWAYSAGPSPPRLPRIRRRKLVGAECVLGGRFGPCWDRRLIASAPASLCEVWNTRRISTAVGRDAIDDDVGEPGTTSSRVPSIWPGRPEWGNRAAAGGCDDAPEDKPRGFGIPGREILVFEVERDGCLAQPDDFHWVHLANSSSTSCRRRNHPHRPRRSLS